MKFCLIFNLLQLFPILVATSLEASGAIEAEARKVDPPAGPPSPTFNFSFKTNEKENHTGLAVSEFFQYSQTDTDPVTFI